MGLTVTALITLSMVGCGESELNDNSIKEESAKVNHVIEYPEGYDTDEWQDAWGKVEFNDWLFTLNDSSDYIHFTAPNGEEGDFLNQ